MLLCLLVCTVALNDVTETTVDKENHPISIEDSNDNITDPHYNTSHGHDIHGNGHHGIHVASWNYEYVKGPLVITMFMIITAICKLGKQLNQHLIGRNKLHTI